MSPNTPTAPSANTLFTPQLDRVALNTRYQQIRGFTEVLSQPLAVEDYGVQSMPDASPTKWHLAHTSWFFETFVLAKSLPDYKPFRSDYNFLFNSYYVGAGKRLDRAKRGMITRPTVEEVFDYRKHVDSAMLDLMRSDAFAQVASVIELGLHHEQQHQELLLTDIKHALWLNPLRPAYQTQLDPVSENSAPKLDWNSFNEGIYLIGHDGRGFSYDNEGPRHKEYIHAFKLASRPVTNGEYLHFMNEGGYQTPAVWLSDGWATAELNNWNAPLYWEQRDGKWWHFTLGGMKKIDLNAPVCHVSYYEANAFATWRGARLPTEAEWELAASDKPLVGNFVESAAHEPRPVDSPQKQNLSQLYGDVWEWTQSAYSPYPGYSAPRGAIGEYNGKFMCNQFVLRGGSCATSQSHVRHTYRNFFYPNARWQFSGFRLAASR